MKNQLFLYLTICFAIGIIISDFIIPGANLRIYFILLLFGLFISQLLRNNTLKTISFLLQFILMGALFYQPFNEKEEPHQLVEKNKVLTLKITENYKPTQKNYRFRAINIVNNEQVILNLPKQKESIYPSDTIIIFGTSYPSPKQSNPYQFDYKTFLTRKNISHTIYTTKILKINNNHTHWRKWIIKSKEDIQNKLTSAGYNKDTRSIISSMLLGDKTELSDEINKNYVATGVIHILSISGLHVVMIFIIVQFSLGPLLLIKNGRILRIVFSLVFIWLFAVYVELHAPVIRAALMLTIYYISELLKRPKNIYHTLSLTAFILLIYHPNYLFDVGFQLSFSAVFFIIWLNPIYKKWIKPKHKFSQYIYDLSTTSLSAQLGTLPCSAFYFNQFSGLFLLVNLVLVPASFFMIIGSIIAVIMAILNLNIPIYTTLFNSFIWACNSYIK